MKTTFFIATAIFISSFAGAQQADIRSTTSSGTRVTGSPSGTAVKSSTQHTTEVKGEAGGSGHNNTSIMAVSSGQYNKNNAGTSIKASNNATTSVSVTQPADIKKSSHSTVNQSLETSGNVVTHTGHAVRAKSGSTVSASQSATKNVQARAKRSVWVNAKTDASVNGDIRPIPFKASSMISSRTGLGL